MSRSPISARALPGPFWLIGALGLVLLMLPGCPSPSDGNPRVLWLAPDGSEIRVKLVDTEPHPF